MNSENSFRLVIYTSVNPGQGAKYGIMKLRERFPAAVIVAVNSNSWKYRLHRIKILIRKINRRGLPWFLKKMMDSYSLRTCQVDWSENTRAWFRKEVGEIPAFEPDYLVDTVNGAAAQNLLKSLKPEVVMQMGAGILKPGIFNVASIATLNMHHGMAPMIRGGDSLFWGLFFGRPEWVGVTLHEIDQGIDTGKVLARRRISYQPGDHPGKVYVMATLEGIAMLIEALSRLEQEGTVEYLDTSGDPSVYKSFYSSADYLRLKDNQWNPVQSLEST